MSKPNRTEPSDPTSPKTLAEAARQSPSAVFDEPDDVVHSDDLTKTEKKEVLAQWQADAKSLQTATSEGMHGGKRPRLDEVNAAQTELEANMTASGDMADLEKPTAPIIVTADAARGALGSDEIALGATLLPMLIGGLVLVVVGMIAVVLMI